MKFTLTGFFFSTSPHNKDNRHDPHDANSREDGDADGRTGFYLEEISWKSKSHEGLIAVRRNADWK